MFPYRFPTRAKKKKSREPESKQDWSGLEKKVLPRHIAIIMDGNGRWAESRGLPRAAGHRQGVETLKEIVRACMDLGIAILTVYAFSTENWKRPREEVDILMGLLVEYLQKEIRELDQQGVRIQTIGETGELPRKAREELQMATERTAKNNRLVLNVAINYGGRTEIVRATKEISRLVFKGELRPEDIDEDIVSRHLFTRDLPDPDLLIRPSGEYRISNFLLWQLAYTEFWFTDVHWPDFRKEYLIEAIRAFQMRDRRFGGL
ncbi:MAG TPA: isoprenyl transferase [Clostridia bacterium]|nr:isoprenyl transferase [Clostridia bacterium]